MAELAEAGIPTYRFMQRPGDIFWKKGEGESDTGEREREKSERIEVRKRRKSDIVERVI